ncbi:hypothetical protein Nepgr_003230 [Nepenthes gracilis]|uniref:Uncharacterized protein n=1 Tax=Nepenthes gracilis TaxID=150966 RepID=A0AAD3RZ35_NEPGR|nr:hypothetical protein Nepgr_003230 [Nepenthes gracilis]
MSPYAYTGVASGDPSSRYDFFECCTLLLMGMLRLLGSLLSSAIPVQVLEAMRSLQAVSSHLEELLNLGPRKPVYRGLEALIAAEARGQATRGGAALKKRSANMEELHLPRDSQTTSSSCALIDLRVCLSLEEMARVLEAKYWDSISI